MEVNATLFAFVLGLSWPPGLPSGETVDSGTSPSLLEPTETLREGVAIATTPPVVDFLYYDCQTYEAEGGVWSHWGDGLVVGDVFYSAIGDHLAPEGNAFLYAYDAGTKQLEERVDLRSILEQPEGRYTPGKIHSQIGLGSDGWLYFSTHRGSTKIAFHPTAEFRGDWILRHHPGTGASEIVAHAPLPMQCLPTGQLDPERMIFYAGTADGRNEEDPRFLAYDLRADRVLAQREHGPARALILSSSTGRVYFNPEKKGAAPLVRFDPATPGKFETIEASLGLRCATPELSDGSVYTAEGDALWRFDVKTETAEHLGPTAVGEKDYLTSLDVDPSNERFLYYVPGSHGGAQVDGSPLVQYDLETGRRKVIAFLADYCEERFGFVPMGSYCSAVSGDGALVFISWMGNRGGADEKGKLRFNTCALTVVHVPESERR